MNGPVVADYECSRWFYRRRFIWC